MRRWGSKVESWEVEKSREAIQNMKNTGKKAGKPSCPEKQTNPKNPTKKKTSITLREDRKVKTQVEKG